MYTISLRILNGFGTAKSLTHLRTHSHIAGISSAEQYTARAVLCDRATEDCGMKRKSRFFAGGFLVALLPTLAAAQTTISGRVTSDAGTPVPAASVFLEGLSVGTQTDDAGRYTFTVPTARATGQSSRLTARSIGYTSRTSPVTLNPGQVALDFVLPLSPLQLEKVVVTGAGTTSTRAKLGNVINTVDSSLIRRSNEPQNVV